jgi:Flp pilus assembly protein TadB
MKLFSDPRGITMVVVGLIMMSIGGFVMYRMVRFDI